MNRTDSPAWSDSTRCVHAGGADDPATGAVVTPIHQSSTFLLDDDAYAAIAAGRGREGLIYTRYANPSQRAVQARIAALEGAEDALVFSSGLAAIAATLAALTEPGGHVLAARELYGGTLGLLRDQLPRWGRSAGFADLRDPAAAAAAIRPETAVLYVETISNPTLRVADLPALAAFARRHGLLLVVDNTFATPLGVRPLEHGADLVLHSASKYLNGHSDLIAGAVAGRRELIDRIWLQLKALGGCLDPHACFLLERGLKTLAVRLRAHAASAQAVAEALAEHPAVTRVLYPGLRSHPDHVLARKLLACFGGMVSFVVDGGDEAALRLCRRLRLAKEATSLGGVETLVSLPFNTSHVALSAEERAAAGIPPGMVRLSVGIEDPPDLIADLVAALAGR
ncbi:MAG: aminotransferase class I/II-fold pyridoxal phosphate-dependent enzyme [Planctomycetota bacterium]|nr:MAG: aminotransferase class I/II-fold pyridoxal phosphate-dependent enzyme [Planctomycetota bacterium]